MTETSRLTGPERSVIDRALTLADIADQDALRAHTGVSETELAYACAFGEAQHLLGELSAIIGRLDASEGTSE